MKIRVLVADGKAVTMNHRRWARYDRLGERFVRDLQVGLVLQRRHPQRVAVVAEAVF